MTALVPAEVFAALLSILVACMRIVEEVLLLWLKATQWDLCHCALAAQLQIDQPIMNGRSCFLPSGVLHSHTCQTFTAFTCQTL